jgi:site-specific DNA-methyltransferase (adenine-specific)
LVTLSKMEDNSVDLVVTSPPYNKNFWNKGRERKEGDFIRKIEYSTYDDNLPQEEYVEWQKK